MTFWDWIALITGIAGVLLTIFETIWCWPVALISVIISGVAFFNQRLFGDFGLQIFILLVVFMVGFTGIKIKMYNL